MVDGGGMLLDGSVEVRPGIEETWDSCVVFCEDLYDCWRTKEIWGGLMTESFSGVGIGITSGDKSFLFEFLSLLLKHWLSRGVFCEDLDDCWQTKDRWGRLMTKLFNEVGTGITGDDNLLHFEWIPLWLSQRLSQGVFVVYPDFFLLHFCGNYQYPLDVAWWMQYEFVVVFCACYFVFLWPSKGESKNFGETTLVMFDFQYQE